MVSVPARFLKALTVNFSGPVSHALYILPLPNSYNLLPVAQRGLVPHAYKPGPNHSTLRHPSGNGKVGRVWIFKIILLIFVAHYWLSALSRLHQSLDSDGKPRSQGEDQIHWYRRREHKLVKCWHGLGLSNFNMLKTKRIMQIAKIKPVVNQVEMHP